MRRAVDDEVPGAVEEEAGSAAVRRVLPDLLGALPVHALSALGIVVAVRDVDPRQVTGDDAADAWRCPGSFVFWPLAIKVPTRQMVRYRAT